MYLQNQDLLELLEYSLDEVRGESERASELSHQFNDMFYNETNSRNDILNIYVMNSEGKIYSSVFDDAVGDDCSDSEYFKRAMNGDKLVVDDVVYSDRLNANVNMISQTISKDGQKIGVITAVLDTSVYEAIVHQYENEGLEGFITDSQGNFVFHDNNELIGKSFADSGVPGVDGNNVPQNGVLEYEYNNTDYIAAYETVDGLGWKVFIKGKCSDIFSAIFKIRIILWGVAALLLLVSISIVYIMAKKFSAPIVDITEKVQMLSEGDFTIKMEESHISKEIYDLSSGFNNMIRRISELISGTSNIVENLQSSSENLCATSEEVSASNSEITNQVSMISQSVNDQAANSQISSDKTTELGVSIDVLENENGKMKEQGKAVAESLNDSVKKIKYLMEASSKSNESFNAVKKSVEELIIQVDNISNTINIIEEISEQTNLLALNASIESARAGEAGKGFAIVAEEIRQLSEQVQKSTDNIAQNINTINSTVDYTQKTIAESEKLNEGQSSAYNDVRNSFKSMAYAVNDMISITNTISRDIDSINSTKDEVLRLTEEVACKSQEIASVVEEINSSIDEQARAFEQINTSAEELTSMSESVTKSISVFKI
ncbi:MAG: methyl-accepting chemotaxis protein [Clostridium sp.]